jgi:capsid protein
MAVFTPEGWEPAQMKAEQPTASFKEVCEGYIAEAGRPFSMPKNVALCDSSEYNYASGRLDHQTYFKSIRVEQAEIEDVVLDRILEAWLAEAGRIFDLGDTDEAPHQWFWDGREHVDPAKEATAAEKLLKAGLLTEAEYHARRGVDWEEHQEQRKRESKGRATRRLPQPWETAAAPDEPDDENEDEEDRDGEG